MWIDPSRNDTIKRPANARKLDGTATLSPRGSSTNSHERCETISALRRTLVADLPGQVGETVVLRGWVFRLRVLARSTFVVLKDCSGEAQCVMSTEAMRNLKLKLDDALEIQGTVRSDERAKTGIEIDIRSATILNRAATLLPFNSASDIDHVSAEIKTEYR